MVRITFLIFYFTGVEPHSAWLEKEIIWTWVVKNKKSENVHERTDENTVTKRSKSVHLSRKNKSVNLQFELDFVGLRWRALYGITPSLMKSRNRENKISILYTDKITVFKKFKMKQQRVHVWNQKVKILKRLHSSHIVNGRISIYLFQTFTD